MTTDSRKLGPTLTLARLYESQQQFLDALAIYRRLHQERGSEEAAEKIAQLEERILTDKALSYDSLITRIFSRDELKKLKILPADRYEAWKKSLEETGLEHEPEVDVETPAQEEPLPDPSSAPPVDAGPIPSDSSHIASTPETQEPAKAGHPEVLDLTLGQFIEKLRQLGDSDTPLGEIPLGELLAAICRGGR